MPKRTKKTKKGRKVGKSRLSSVMKKAAKLVKKGMSRKQALKKAWGRK